MRASETAKIIPSWVCGALNATVVKLRRGLK